jgi:hypothetical protein
LAFCFLLRVCRLKEASITSSLTTSIILKSHPGRQETSELWCSTTGRSKVEEFSVGEPIETEDDGLFDVEVDDLIKTRTNFDCPVE